VARTAIAKGPALVQLDVATHGSQIEPFLFQKVLDKKHSLEVSV
jgi:hypothetical protein